MNNCNFFYFTFVLFTTQVCPQRKLVYLAVNAQQTRKWKSQVKNMIYHNIIWDSTLINNFGMFFMKTYIFIWSRGHCDTRMGLLLSQRLQRQPIWGILWIKQRSCREDDEFRDIPPSLNNNKTCGWAPYRNPITNLIFLLIVPKKAIASGTRNLSDNLP